MITFDDYIYRDSTFEMYGLFFWSFNVSQVPFHRSEFAFLKMHQKWLHLRPAYTSDFNFCVFHFRDIYINITLDWMRPCLQVLTNHKFPVTSFLWSEEASKVVAFKTCIHLRLQLLRFPFQRHLHKPTMLDWMRPCFKQCLQVLTNFQLQVFSDLKMLLRPAYTSECNLLVPLKILLSLLFKKSKAIFEN